jgi:hypothetical protein
MQVQIYLSFKHFIARRALSQIQLAFAVIGTLREIRTRIVPLPGVQTFITTRTASIARTGTFITTGLQEFLFWRKIVKFCGEI